LEKLITQGGFIKTGADYNNIDFSNGGSGGTTGTFTPVEVESLDEILDRYKEINDALADMDQELKNIERDKNRAWGANKLAAYDKEIAKYK
jgi:hypothetical protein